MNFQMEYEQQPCRKEIIEINFNKKLLYQIIKQDFIAMAKDF
jgi:hypothetical protein